MARASGCIYDEERGYAIHTWSGKALYPNDIQPEDISIEDIAHGLSMIPRYGGQADKFYSVAQHSVYCYHLADDKDKREALLHDAVEYVLGADYPRPHKMLIPALSEFEKMIEKQLHPILGIPISKSEAVRFIDETMLATEMPLLFQRHGTYIQKGNKFIYTGNEPIMEGLPPRLNWSSLPSWTPKVAEDQFLKAYEMLLEQEAEHKGYHNATDQCMQTSNRPKQQGEVD